IETQDSLGNNLNVSLLGLPAENDWILYGPYSDKSLIRNVLAYTLAAEINDYAPRTKFCELMLNGAYLGVYVFTEKIKRDDSRVNITKLLPEENSEPEITGGYIFKRDRVDDGNISIRLNTGLELVITEPDEKSISISQKAWLKKYLNDFESALYNSNGKYRDYIDVLTFVDNFLIVEFTKNIDGYRLSTYFYKDRNEKIKAGPVWDYNLSFGNADYNDGWSTEGWYYPLIWEMEVYWFDDLINDPEFNNLCATRWQELRQNTLNIPHIFSLIDEWVELLSESQERNFSRWAILGLYIWPNPGYSESGNYGFVSPTSGAPSSWIEEIEYIKDFISERVQWMDEQFGVKFTELHLEIRENGWGKIIYNDKLISDYLHVGVFPTDSLLSIRAEPASGYRFIRWEETNLGNESINLISKCAIWKYLDNGTDQGTDWRELIFNDSEWKEDAAELGYGDGDEATVISYGPNSNQKYITTYFRKTFTISDVDNTDKLTLELLRDDGAIVYLNGSEVVRSNMPGGVISYNTLASDYISGENEKIFHKYSINPDYLLEGNNVIAVEVHQATLSSSDLSFDFRLSAEKIMGNENEIISTDRELCCILTNDNSLITAVFEPDETNTASILINEILASNDSCNIDNFGEYEDWIEIFNCGDLPFDIGGLYFSDDLENPKLYQIPTNVSHLTTVKPDSFLILWADSDTSQGALHLNFKLDKSGESLSITRISNGEINYIDLLYYLKQNTDVSYGRLPDGSNNWCNFSVPTPGYSNRSVATDYRQSGLPRDFALEQNYPNPFNERTNISYQLPYSTHVNISIYNMLGQLVKTLVNGNKEAGFYTVNWDAAGVSSGLYLYTIQAGDFSEIKKCIFMK
ncbi:MAG: CotH kinase family protein, partial [Bacteroidetes bacterium]|nr:CotH kinase family protein [Bacteroidota bacterium]